MDGYPRRAGSMNSTAACTHLGAHWPFGHNCGCFSLNFGMAWHVKRPCVKIERRQARTNALTCPISHCALWLVQPNAFVVRASSATEKASAFVDESLDFGRGPGRHGPEHPRHSYSTLKVGTPATINSGISRRYKVQKILRELCESQKTGTPGGS